MLKNYLKIAVRNLWKNKTYALINVLGMSVAFASCLLLFLTAYHELSFDNFQENGKQLFMIYQQTGAKDKSETMPAPLEPALRKEFPQQIANISRVVGSDSYIRYNNKEVVENVQFVDAGFLNMFSFPVLNGQKSAGALRNLSSIVLTETTAKAIFGTENPVGKTVQMKQQERWSPFVVSAVVADTPENSSVRFDALARFEAEADYHIHKDTWDNRYHNTYIQLIPSVTQASVEEQLRGFVKKYYAGNIKNLKRDGGQPDEKGDLLSLRLLPFAEMHFATELGGGSVMAIKKSYPYLLLIVAGFIVLIACINFINLSTARSLTRAREVGMRKALGAIKSQLIFQFWGEALILCLIALSIGGLLAWSLLPELKSIFKSATSITYLKQPVILISLLAGFLFITLVAGGYPAWFITRFSTVKVLKGSLSIGKAGSLRNVLLIVQFGIATLLMICTLVAWQQMNFLQNMPLGFNEDQVISIPINGGVNGRQALKLFRDRVAQEPNVLSVTGAYKNFGRGRDGSTFTSIVGFEHKNREVKTHWQIVDYDYLKTLDIKLIAGRDFSTQFATDSTESIIINEEMAKQLNEKNPVGTLLNVNPDQPMRVIGVVKNYHHESLKRTIQPNSLILDPKTPLFYILVKVRPDNVPATMATMERVWKEISPKGQFQGSFLDENTNRQYQNEKRLSQLFISAAVLAILLSCMGLFAIAVMVMAQRRKEVGVRKVLGASVSSIVLLLSKDFLKLVITGIVIASPIAWYAMNQWLQDYAYKITIEWWVFAVAALAAILIAFFTVSFQSIKAALTNPVRSLKSE